MDFATFKPITTAIIGQTQRSGMWAPMSSCSDVQNAPIKASVPAHKMIEFLASRLMAASLFRVQLTATQQVRNGSGVDIDPGR
jgi:hypothetical protein